MKTCSAGCSVFAPDSESVCSKCGAALLLVAGPQRTAQNVPAKPAIGKVLLYGLLACAVILAISLIPNATNGVVLAPGQSPTGPVPKTAAPSSDVVIRYVKMNAPCALGRSSAAAVSDAIRARDDDALQGLLERGKIVRLAAGTRFEWESSSDGLVWGFVRSGRETGRDCYILPGLLQETP
jgi:hypothetical protein